MSMYSTIRTVIALALAIILAGNFGTVVHALTVTEAVNSIQSAPPATLPNVTNPR